MTRVAAIDCGTNSIRLLVADTVDGTLVDVVRELRMVGLGAGVDRTGRLAPEAIERTRTALREYATTIRRLGADRVRMVATSATRDAANRSDFVDVVRAELGIEAQVITGTEEAALSFSGAAGALPRTTLGPLVVCDIGGGSTELVRGDHGDGGDPSARPQLASHSMDVGCVRLTERHLHDDPPTQRQVRAVVDDVRTALAAARVDVQVHPDDRFVGVAGTVTTVAALALGLERYDPDRLHGATVSTEQVHAITERLLQMPRHERAALPSMHPGRVGVIGAGALVLRTVLDELGVPEMITSEHDLLDGIASSLI